MPIVNIKILNNTHQIACDDGEQDKLLSLAHNLDVRISKLGNANNTSSEIKLLVLNSLMMEAKIQELEKQLSNTQDSQTSEETIVKTLNTITDYVENLAKKLESL